MQATRKLKGKGKGQERQIKSDLEGDGMARTVFHAGSRDVEGPGRETAVASD